MKIYYAHCIAIYNTSQESRDLLTLSTLGFEISNPNCAECQAGYQAYGMAFFKKFAMECDAVAFRGLPDGAIPAGIAQEVAWFVEVGKPIIELPSAVLRRIITVEATREYLKETGQR